VDAHSGLGCESELRVRSYGCFHLINEGDGPRHASCETVSPSNLGRPPTLNCRGPGGSRQVAGALEVARFYTLDLSDRGSDNCRAMPQEQLRQIVDTLRARVQQELEAQLVSLAEQQDQALEAVRRATASETDERWTAKTESLKAEWTARLESEVAAARAEAERRFVSETARVRSEADQAIAKVRAEAEQAAAEMVARVRAEAEESVTELAAKFRGEAEQAAAVAAVCVREEADQEIETERLRNIAVLDAERERWSADLDAEHQRAEAMLAAERQRLDAERQIERQRMEADRVAERQRFDAERQQFRIERQRFEAERQQFAVERDRFQSADHGGDAARRRAEQLDADLRRLESELAAERQQLHQVNEALQHANASLGRAQRALEEERQARAAEHLARLQAEAVAAQSDAARPTNADTLTSESQPATIERLFDGMRRMDSAESLTEILTTLVDAAGAEAPRAALFIASGASGNDMQGFRARGFASDIGLVRVKGDRLFDEATERAEAVTISVHDDMPAPRFASLATDRAALAVPMLIGGEPVAMMYADDATTAEGTASSASWPAAVQILTRHAALCLAHLTATRTTQAMQVMAAPPASDEESSAKRYARLLVSEIKLYNEAAVRAGREHRDLMTRLRPEIERARRLYEDRVSAGVGHHMFFQQELVQTLAEGDAALLGEPA
jgi:hypothetical protein